MYRIAVSGSRKTSPRSILSTVYLLLVRKLPKNQGKSVDDSWQCEAYTHSPLKRAFFALLESKSVAVCQVKLAGSAVVFRALRQIHQDIDWTLFSNHQIHKKNNFSKQHVEFMLFHLRRNLPRHYPTHHKLTNPIDKENDEACPGSKLGRKTWTEKSQIHSVPEGQNELSKSKFGTAAFSYQVVSHFSHLP